MVHIHGYLSFSAGWQRSDGVPRSRAPHVALRIDEGSARDGEETRDVLQAGDAGGGAADSRLAVGPHPDLWIFEKLEHGI